MILVLLNIVNWMSIESIKIWIKLVGSLSYFKTSVDGMNSNSTQSIRAPKHQFNVSTQLRILKTKVQFNGCDSIV